MSVATSTLALSRPGSLREALELLSAGDVSCLAGCTDIFVNLHFGTTSDRRFVDLWPLDELRGITAEGDATRVGALTTWSELRDSPLIAERIPMLAAAAREVGGVQIQNRGTLGGNIANGSPAGDGLPVLAAAEAVVILRSAAGERRVPFGELYTGYRATVIRPEELIAAVEIPSIPGRQWFRKVGTRAAQAISKVVMAAVRAPQPRIAFGSVAATVVRLPRTEACLAGGGDIQAAQRVLMEEIRPIDDIRSTGEYRKRVAANLLAQWWQETG